MDNKCCRFNFCPLIIALFIGGIVAALVGVGVISIAAIVAILPFIFAIALVIIALTIFIILGLLFAQAIDNIEIRNRCCCNNCCICPLLRTIILVSIILLVVTLIGIGAIMETVSIFVAILIGIIIAALAFTLFTFIELVNCIIKELCNED